MSDVRDPDRDQAAPIPNDSVAVQDLVMADIEERKQHGIRKYGTALQVGNGRDMLRDAYEEVLDLAVYLRGMLAEQEASGGASAAEPESQPPQMVTHTYADGSFVVHAPGMGSSVFLDGARIGGCCDA